MRNWNRQGYLVCAVLVFACVGARADSSSLSALPQYDQFNGVAADRSGGFIIVGAQAGERSGESVGRLHWLGPDGEVVLNLTLSAKDASASVLSDVARLSDGDVVAAGWSRPLGATTDNCWVTRVSVEGRQRWSKVLTSPNHERCYFIQQLPGGDLLAGGRTEDDATGKGAALGATWRLDAASGDLRPPGRVTFGADGARRSAFQDAVVLSDGSLILAGWLTEPSRGDDDAWIVKLDASGLHPVWKRKIGGSGPDLITAVVPYAAGGVIALGYTTKAERKSTSGLMLALDPSGSTIWTREVDVGDGGNDKLLGSAVRPDGTLVAVGTVSEDEKAPLRGWFVQADRDGKVIHSRQFEDPYGGRLTAVALDGENGVVAVGAARNDKTGDIDGWITWLDLPSARPATIAGTTDGKAQAPSSEVASTSCARDSYEVPMGTEICGIGLTLDNRLRINGKTVTGPHQRSVGSTPKVLVLSPSNSGRYTVVQLIENDYMLATYLVDTVSSTAIYVGVGVSSPGVSHWIAWSEDERYAVLALRDLSFAAQSRIKWLFALSVPANDAKERVVHSSRIPFDNSIMFPDELTSDTSSTQYFTWIGPRRFRVQLTECLGSESCNLSRMPGNLTAVELDVTEQGLKVAQIQDTSKVSSSLRNSLQKRKELEAAIVRGDACKHIFHEIVAGKDACGISFDLEHVRVDGQIVADTPEWWRQDSPETQKLVVYPTSPSGRYTVINGCSYECGWMLFIDHVDKKATSFQTSKYGPNKWIAWNEQEKYFLLLNYDDGVDWLQTVSIPEARVYATKYSFLSAPPDESFSWSGMDQFKLDLACSEQECTGVRYPQDLTKVEFLSSDHGITIKSVEDPSKISASMLKEVLANSDVAVADFKRLKNMPVRERPVYVSEEHENIAIHLASMSFSGFTVQYKAILRVFAVDGEKAEADWPLALHLNNASSIDKPGWFVVSGYLTADADPSAADTLPVGIMKVEQALRCSANECASSGDLLQLIRVRRGLAQLH